MQIEIIIGVLLLAFLMQFFDAFLGQGFGTLTPLLILLGFAPVESVFSVLFASAVLSLVAGFFHHSFENVDFSLKSRDLNIALVLIGFGIIGVGVGSFLALSLSDLFVEIYIAFVVILVGVNILVNYNVIPKFSWKKLSFFGAFGAFNKGITGGGYGPVVTAGQILSGVSSRKSVSTTALAEGVISSFGIIIFLFLGTANGFFNVNLIVSLLIGGLLSTPIAAYAVKHFNTTKLKIVIAVTNIAVGIVLILKLLLF